MPGRNAQVSRIYAILDILEGTPHGLTVSELTTKAAERGHEASQRTIYRDLEALNAAGFPLFPHEEKGDQNATRWKLERRAQITQYLVLDARELMALYFARSCLTPLKDTPFYDDLNSAFRKLEEKLGTKGREHLGELSQEIRFEPMPRWSLAVDPDLLETVRACCSERHVLQVEYESVNGGTKRVRRLGPHYLYFAKASMYLVAEDLEDGRVKLFALPRMRDAKFTEDAYEGAILDPEEMFQHSMGTYRGERPLEVQIEFSSHVAQYVKERRWHPSQRVVSHENGSIILSLNVARTPDLTQWILSFGAAARVVGPVEVRDAIARAAEETLARYRKPAA